MRILPAGVPRSVRLAKARIAAFFDGAPLLFIGLVLVIAVVFRLGIGAVKPAAAADEPDPTVATRHVPVTPAVTAIAPAVTPVPAVAAPVVSAQPELPAPKPMLPKRRPRAYGKR